MKILKSICIIFFLFSFVSNLLKAQTSETIFVDDVEVVEYLVLEICLNKEDEVKSVDVKDDKSSYDNAEIISNLKNIQSDKEFTTRKSKNNNCFNYKYYFVNKKYELLELEESEFEKCKKFKKGKFIYIRPYLSNVIIKRGKRIQRENSDKYKLNWISPCEYNMFYIKVPEYPRLEGQTLNVKIIDILENGDYVYRTNFKDKVISFGVLRKKD